jgi:hypothetical protein
MIAPAFRLTALAAVVALGLCGVAAAQSNEEEGGPSAAPPPSTSPIQSPSPPEAGGPSESPGEEGPPEGGPPPESGPPEEGMPAAAPCPRNMRGRTVSGMRCSCSPRQMSGSVWGSIRYTADSSVCRAALHAGVITPQGGVVKIWSGPGCGRFVGSLRNGVRTGNWGRYGATYAFRSPLPRCAEQAAVTPPPGGGEEDTEGSSGGSPRAAGCDPSFGGKYVTLLRRIYVPQDARRYGRCRDYGRYTGSSWAGHHNLPPGYWTYRYPHWYIWSRRTR